MTAVSKGLAADSYIETAEGPIRLADAPGKGFAVLTRLPDGQLGFRQYLKLEAHEDVPLVRVSFDSGHAVLAGRGHIFYRHGMEGVAAEALQPGDRLETAYHYPPGYSPPGHEIQHPGITVRAVEAAGQGRILTGTVRDTHALFLTAGVLCAE